MWPEVDLAEKENRRELKLSGGKISEKIESGGLDLHIFNLTSLNLLNISDTKLVNIPNEIGNLQNLNSLLFYGNCIKIVPAEFGKLVKLKVLDLSKNSIEIIPDELSMLPEITTINLSNNQIHSFPQLKLMPKLAIIDLSNNKLKEFPRISGDNLSHVSELKLKGNEIEEIPAEIGNLHNLKVLELSSNKIKLVPKILAASTKLKEIDLKNNPIADKRLLKLIDQCRSKQILDYVKQHGSIVKIKEDTNKNEGGDNEEISEKLADVAIIESVKKNKIIIEKYNDDTKKIIYCNEVRDVRPHIVSCILKNIDITDPNKFKHFIQIQSKLHDTTCEKREACTIATHDLQKITGDIRFTAKPPKRIELLPLDKIKKVTAFKFYEELKNQAEIVRKEKKRNTYSGIHKYLYLLANKDLYPCLEDANKNIISLPPLTNSDITKITSDTKDVLIEITSSETLAICKKAMEELLNKLLVIGISKVSDVSEKKFNEITVQQIKIIDIDSNLKAIYPSKVDLHFDEDSSIIVERLP